MFENTVSLRLRTWYFITLFFSYTSLFLNTAIIYDLKQVISNPFNNGSKRINLYIVEAVVAGIVSCAIGL